MKKKNTFNFINNSKGWIRKISHGLLWLSASFYTSLSFASSGAIPTPPSDQQINNGQDFMDVIKNTAKDAVPIVFPILEIVGIVIALWLIMTSLHEAKRKDDWGVMKTAVFWAAICIGFVFTLAYEGNQIGTGM